MAFVPDVHDNVVGVAYTLWTGEEVWAARRKAMTLRFARAAAQRLQGHLDPGA